jgi:plastocyanin
MKSVWHSLIMIALLSLSSFSINSVDSKEEARPVNAPSRHHGNWQEKRFVARVAKGVQRVEMVGGEYFFDPNYIVVKVNKPVEITIKKTAGYIRHNLVATSPEAGIVFNVDLKEEEAQTVKFTPKRIGKYPIYSDKSMFGLKSDREKGMEGLIVVVK